MTDGVAVTPGSGATIATDDISGLQHQRVKIEYGADGSATDVSKATPLPVAERSSSAALTQVAVSTSSTTLKAANTNRTVCCVYNDSTADLYIALATTASTSAFTVRIGPGGYYETPAGYTGAVSGIWSAATGTGAKVTELTAG